jgi:hypothetical protein
MGFKRDFSLGKKGEKAVLNLLKKCGVQLEENTDTKKRKDYDLVGKIGTKKVTVEVKLDWMCADTGNLAIEYHNSRKDEPSGIDATKAKIWAHVILDSGNPTIWVTSTKTLKSYITNNKPKRIVQRAGDGNASLYLYQDDIILPAIFKRIDNITKEAALKIVKSLI